MSTRAHGPMAGFHWLRRAINVGRHNPRALFGAASVLVMVGMLPGVLQLLLHALFNPGEGGALVIAALMTVLWLALMAPLMAGYLRLLDAGERGRPAHASEVFQVFHARPMWRTTVGFSLVMLLVYVAVTGGLVAQLGSDFLKWSDEVLRIAQQAQQASPDAPPPVLPAPPPGTASLFGLGSLWLLLFGCAFAVGLGQIALTGRGVRAAFVDGFAGMAKNLLPLLVMAVLAFGAMVVVSIGLFVVILLVGGIGTLISPMLAMMVFLPLYVLFLTVLYAVLLSVMYQLWRDIAGDDGDPVDTLGPGQIAA